MWQRFCDRFLKRPLLTVFRSFMNFSKSVLWRMAIILKANKGNLFVSSVFFFLFSCTIHRTFYTHHVLLSFRFHDILCLLLSSVISFMFCLTYKNFLSLLVLFSWCNKFQFNLSLSFFIYI
jgi:hypothetical protein